MLLTTLRMAHPQALLRPVLIALLLLAPLSFAAGARPEPASSPDMAAAAAPGAWPAGRPLAGLLNPDGTLNLNTGYMGSLDPAGWRMETAAGGRPRLMRITTFTLAPRSGPDSDTATLKMAVFGETPRT